jgi:WD40 repeat protein
VTTKFIIIVTSIVSLTTHLRAQTPELVIQTGHTGSIHGIAFSPDGRLLLTCGWDNLVKFWDVYSGQELRSIDEGARVNAVNFSPDGQDIALGQDDRTVVVLDAKTGQRKLAIAPRNVIGIDLLSYNPKGVIVAAAAYQTLLLLDTQSGKTILTFKTDVSRITAVRFSPDASTIACADSGKAIYLFDARSGDSIAVLPCHGKIIAALAFSPDGHTIAAAEGSADAGVPVAKPNEYSILLWQLPSGTELQELGHEPMQFDAIDFHPSGKSIVSTSINGRLVLWDVETRKEVNFIHTQKFAASRAAFSPDGKLIAASNDSTVTIIETNSFKTLYELKPHSYPLKQIAFNSRLNYFATASGESVRLWSNLCGKDYQVINENSLATSVAFNASGTLLALGSANGAVKLYDLDSGKTVTLGTHSHNVTCLAFNSAGTVLASAGGDNTIVFWDVGPGHELRTRRESLKITVNPAFVNSGLAYWTNSLAFTPDGLYLISANGWGSSDGGVFMWDATTGRRVSVFAENVNRVFGCTLSSDGETLATSGFGEVVLWNVTTGQKIRTLKHRHGEVNSLAFSHDGKLLASANQDGTVAIWEVASGSERSTFTGHTGQVTSVAFNNDASILCSAGADATARLWSVTKGNEIAKLVGVGNNDFVVATSDNYYMASPRAFEGVAFRVGERAHPFQQFDLRLNRPDIVLQRVGSTSQALVDVYEQAHRDRLRREGIADEPPANSTDAPTIQITNRQIDRTTNNNVFDLKLTAKDSESSLSRFRVLVNGVPIADHATLVIPTHDAHQANLELPIELSAGNNRIDCSVVNVNGIESLTETFDVTYDKPVKPHLFVLTVGVSKYQHPELNLRFASKDAQDFANFWHSRETYYEGVKILSLLDQASTREGILAMKEVMQLAGVNDEVIVFFAGHGFLDAHTNYYFGTFDVDPANPSSRGLSYEAIGDLLENLRARKKLLLLDTCHAGDVDDDTLRRLLNILFIALSSQDGTHIIVSSGGAASATEDFKLGNGVFTYALLERLRMSVARHDRAQDSESALHDMKLTEDQIQAVHELNARESSLKVSTLREYLFRRVFELTRGFQQPLSRSENLENDFEILPW